MLRDPIARFRLIALLEGVSFLVLLFIAMPLKYAADMPLAVRVVGMAHGVLFIAYVLLLVDLFASKKFTASRCGIAFVASLLPFGTFAFDRVLKREQEQQQSISA